MNQQEQIAKKKRKKEKTQQGNSNGSLVKINKRGKGIRILCKREKWIWVVNSKENWFWENGGGKLIRVRSKAQLEMGGK